MGHTESMHGAVQRLKQIENPSSWKLFIKLLLSGLYSMSKGHLRQLKLKQATVEYRYKVECHLTTINKSSKLNITFIGSS